MQIIQSFYTKPLIFMKIGAKLVLLQLFTKIVSVDNVKAIYTKDGFHYFGFTCTNYIRTWKRNGNEFG